MSETTKPWEDRIRDAGERVGERIEDEIRRAVRYLDDEVVPEVRRNGSVALRTASEQLRRLADRLDDERQRREGSGS